MCLLHACGCPPRPQEGIWSPVTQVTSDYTLWDEGARNWIRFNRKAASALNCWAMALGPFCIFGFFPFLEAFKCNTISSLNPWDYFLATGVSFRKFLPMPVDWSVLMFSSSTFKLSGLILSSLINFKLIFVQGGNYGFSFIFLHVEIKFSLYHLLKKQSFL